MCNVFLQFYAAEAAQIWRKMQDFNYYSLRITHDGYLKAYQLSHPVIQGYDVILIDEAQDLTPGRHTRSRFLSMA